MSVLRPACAARSDNGAGLLRGGCEPIANPLQVDWTSDYLFSMQAACRYFLPSCCGTQVAKPV